MLKAFLGFSLWAVITIALFTSPLSAKEPTHSKKKIDRLKSQIDSLTKELERLEETANGIADTNVLERLLKNFPGLRDLSPLERDDLQLLPHLQLNPDALQNLLPPDWSEGMPLPGVLEREYRGNLLPGSPLPDLPKPDAPFFDEHSFPEDRMQVLPQTPFPFAPPTPYNSKPVPDFPNWRIQQLRDICVRI